MKPEPISQQQIQALRFAAYKAGRADVIRLCTLAAVGQEAALRECARIYAMSEVA